MPFIVIVHANPILREELVLRLMLRAKKIAVLGYAKCTRFKLSSVGALTVISAEISKELTAMMQAQDVALVYGVDVGPRQWAQRDDADERVLRCIYGHERDWYLSVEPQKDVIEFTSDSGVTVVAWDIAKTLAMIKQSHPPVLEWFQVNDVFVSNDAVVLPLRRLAVRAFRPDVAANHYLQQARTLTVKVADDLPTYGNYVQLLRSLMAGCFILEHYRIPPLSFRALAVEFLPGDLQQEVIRWLESGLYAGGATVPGPEQQQLQQYIREKLDHLARHLPEETSGVDLNEVNQVFRECLAAL